MHSTNFYFDAFFLRCIFLSTLAIGTLQCMISDQKHSQFRRHSGGKFRISISYPDFDFCHLGSMVERQDGEPPSRTAFLDEKRKLFVHHEVFWTFDKSPSGLEPGRTCVSRDPVPCPVGQIQVAGVTFWTTVGHHHHRFLPGVAIGAHVSLIINIIFLLDRGAFTKSIKI